MWIGAGRRAGLFRIIKIGVTILTILAALGVAYLLIRGIDPAGILAHQDNLLVMALILLGFFVLKALTVVLVESTFLYIAAGVFFS
ncbi:MAG TPA: hypothetical protein VIL27_02140, partial [Clostridia bacterium]